jgi:hypothetical protein
MATTSRQTNLFGIEDWRSLYKTYNQADFQSYNFETLRKGFVDYLQQHYPEDFNDYVESSEFIALLDVIAFMGQGIAYRHDLNTRENFIDTAERRDSVVNLAKLVGYTPKRNESSRGFLKVTSVNTTENILDINGNNLSNVTVRFNDTTNVDWQDQFNTIFSSILVDSQKYGKPGRTADILGVTTEEYTVKLVPNLLPVIPFSSTVNGTTMNFEAVSATSINDTKIYEPSPKVNGDFNILFRNDKLGFASPNTGFFFYFKQGTLSNKDFVLSDRIANRNVEVNVDGINNDDIWLYELDTNTGAILNEWAEVENIYASTTTQSRSLDRKFFSVTNRANDQVTLNFGDGVFGDIPTGSFRSFIRNSNGLAYIINPSDISTVNLAIPYTSKHGRVETATFTVSLVQNVSTASTKEDLNDIKRRAPARFYTQNRMVNGEDYNNFPYTAFSSIIKSKAVVRSNIGTSRYLDLVDPTGKYSSVNTFNSDGLLFKSNATTDFTFSFVDRNDIEIIIRNQVEPNLSKRGTVQLYHDNYARKTLPATMSWNQSTTLINETTGFFKMLSGTTLPIGVFVLDNRKFIIANSLIKFIPPVALLGQDPFYFDKNNRLKQRAGGLLPTDNVVLWASVSNVVLDGTNFGLGNDIDGVGPVTLTNFIPDGAVPIEVIPVFNTDLPITVEQDILAQIELYNDFGLGYNNDTGTWYVITSANLDSISKFSLANASDNSGSGLDASWIIKFVSADQIYTVTTRSLKYFFSSVIETRFFFGGHNSIFDPKTGQTVNDFINVLKTNTKPGNNSPLSLDVKMDIIDQPIEPDGFVNDFLVEVSYTDADNNGIADNPDFFADIVTETGLIFFKTLTDADGLERDLPLASDVINTDFNRKNDPGLIPTSFPEGQIFYLSEDTNVFQELVSGVLVAKTDLSIQTGRQDLQFHYRHNSSETKRINPGVTNIIDTFIVTSAYHTAYLRFIQDTTNTVIKPDIPTISELTISYQSLQDYKMLSDNIVLNSVVFKPLFGDKASPELRANITIVSQQDSLASDSEIKSSVVTAMNEYFDINNWDFGDTFYFSELSAFLHDRLGDIIGSVVLVPIDGTKQFGDLYEVRSAPTEIFVSAATVDNVKVITSLTKSKLNGIS